jgi:membrane-bound metal-dependent hydrolase YbcI (DUF457 family)
MPFAFTHMVTAWLLGKGYEQVSQKKLSHIMWFLLLFGSILPDSDFIADWFLGTQVHRTFTHSILFLVVVGVLAFLFFFKQNERKQLAVVISVGILTHLLLDSIFIPGIPWFWPLGTWYSLPISQPISHLNFAIMDMGLGTTWLFFLWWKEKIRF